MSRGKSNIGNVFNRMLGEVNRLHIYHKWLPIERCQISFYPEQLKSLSEEFQSFKITDEDPLNKLLSDRTLNILATTILKYKSVRRSIDLLHLNDPPNLTHVGDRLAFEVAVIYRASTQDFLNAEEERDFQDFASKFHFDKSKFQQQLEGELLFQSFNSPDTPLPDPDVDLNRMWKIVPCSLSRDSAKAKEKYFSQDFPSQLYFGNNKFQEGEVSVGFKVEESNLLQQLASITRKKLKVISIVGMAGLGKTTLATRLYNDPYVVSHFYIRAWATCTQNYQKRDLLLAILRSVIAFTDEVCRTSDSRLALVLYRALKGRRYFIVIDDLWSKEAWDDFKSCFPDDNNGSKILLTTRLKDVALHAQSDGNLLCLPFLTEEESFDLFKRKTFPTGDFSNDLSMIGKIISKKCHGLPLAIVVIAGFLKNNFDADHWAQVAKSASSYIVTDENQYIHTLGLSYNHLPQHLRPCFLSFGAFPEGHYIPVCKLIRLWIAEEFVTQNGTKSSEDVALDYLLDLISRSLVVEGQKGLSASIKTCRIHNLLRDLCLRKAEEENF